MTSVASDPRYPNPNLYDIVLQLSAEPGLDAWWNTVTKILHDSYLADRVSLALPADANDIENVPWGQKATFNVTGRDEESEPSSGSSNQQHASTQTPSFGEQLRTPRPHILNARPGLESRHSYAGAGLTLKDQNQKRAETPSTPGRPTMPIRTVSHMPSLLRNETTFSTTGFTPLSEARQPSFSDPDFSSIGGDRQFIPHVSVFPVLRGLGGEIDNLIDASGVNKVLERGNMVTLTRDYANEQATAQPEGKEHSLPSKSSAISMQKSPAKSSLPYRSFFSTMDSTAQRRGSAYEEYEQQPPSPWSQSPAPSPAIQADPDENPFFSGQDSVEDTFNPSAASPDYSNLQAIEAIGVDKATTVIHLPLIHPTLSGFMSSGGDDSRAPSAQSTPDPRFPPGSNPRERRAPIAIISILSPAVPYPQNLTQSLKMLGPHLAASFSIAQQMSAVQAQAWGIRHRRGTSGRAVGPAPLPLQASNLDHLIRGDFDESGASISGSITSPSDYSGRSKHSPGSSIAGTPGWESMMGGSRSVAGTPAQLQNEGGDGYFEKRRGNMPRSGSLAGGSMSPGHTPVKGGRKSPNPEAKSSAKKFTQDLDDRERRLRAQSASKSDVKSPLRIHAPRDHSPPRSIDTSSPRRANFRHSASMDFQAENADRLHSVLHSYGADFSSSFQSLPASAVPKTPGGSASNVPGRDSSSAEAQDMPPPSERLLRTIIDSLPVQIFTAAPGTGDLTWVNSKFLVYRGQDSRQVLKDPWTSIHPEDRLAYMDQWNKSLRTGQQLQQKVRLQRFDGNYRWFYVRAAPLKDKRQSIVHWIGTNMDFHEQHLAELNAARQQETAASEAKYRALANSSPQVVFTVNRSKGITFCNTQWENYSGQMEAQALGLGFMEHVHPEDIVKCRLPTFDDGTQIATNVPVSVSARPRRSVSSSQASSSGSSDTEKAPTSPMQSPPSTQLPQRKLSELAMTGILKVTRDTDGKASYSTEVRLRSKDGDYRWHLVRVVLADQNLHEDEEEKETWYGTCTDINDHKALERDLKETMDEKSRFLSNMSHEIRTPLNGITGMVNFLIDSKLSDEQMEHVNIIRASTEGLRGLINDILDLSKAEAGMIQLSMDWVHVRSLIEEVNDLTSAMAIDKGLELNYIVEEEVPAQVKGDRFRVRQILLNVIGNAIKFTQVGEVFVRCCVLHNTENNEHPTAPGEILIQFEISDTGQGFTDKEAQYLFKRFSQIDGSSTRQHGGTGLGLVISRQLAQLHGGDMSARGFPGKGATFIFYIKGTLPNDGDRPPPDPVTPGLRNAPSMSSLNKLAKGVAPSITGRPLLGSPLAQEILHHKSPQISPDPSRPSPSISISSSESVPSTRVSRTSTRSENSSASSVFPADITIPARMNIDLSMPSDEIRTESLSSISSQSDQLSTGTTGSPLSPPMYSILVVCPLKHSREATVRHMDMTLPRNVPHSITARASLMECQKMIGGDESIVFTHVVLVLQSIPEIIAFMDQLLISPAHATTQLIIITDLNQRRKITEAAPSYDYDQLTADHRLQYIFKPLKPSKFAFIFDPQKEREMSTDRNQDSAQQVAYTQKQLYDEMTKRLGNRGKRVLLVEDNKVNQMVSNTYPVLVKSMQLIGFPGPTQVLEQSCRRGRDRS